MLLGSTAWSSGNIVPAQGGFVSLFDGSTLNGWNILGSANWSVVDGGAIQATSGNGYLVTPMPYGDFQITLGSG